MNRGMAAKSSMWLYENLATFSTVLDQLFNEGLYNKRLSMGDEGY